MTSASSIPSTSGSGARARLEPPFLAWSRSRPSLPMDVWSRSRPKKWRLRNTDLRCWGAEDALLDFLRHCRRFCFTNNIFVPPYWKNESPCCCLGFQIKYFWIPVIGCFSAASQNASKGQNKEKRNFATTAAQILCKLEVLHCLDKLFSSLRLLCGPLP